jgi:carbon-monoxide dehydrogenase medium subunit
VALALDARMHAISPRGRRDIPAGHFFTGAGSTDLAPDELLTGITFPRWTGRCGFAIEEFTRRHRDFAIAGAAVAVALGADNRILRCAIGLFGIGATPLRAPSAETTTIGSAAHDVAAEDIGRMAMRDVDFVRSDLHAAAGYRSHVGAVMVARAWQRSIKEANRG